jgi:hypothetical protein
MGTSLTFSSQATVWMIVLTSPMSRLIEVCKGDPETKSLPNGRQRTECTLAEV